MDTIRYFFGEGRDLNALQMCCRCIIMFLFAIVMVRLAGRRTFGRQTAFDHVVVIMLGAILSRGIVGSSPFWPVTAAGFVLVIIHRMIAWLSVKNRLLGRIFKGNPRLLYKDGKFDWKEMSRSAVDKEEVMESVRLDANLGSLDDVEEAYQESCGDISIVKKKSTEIRTP